MDHPLPIPQFLHDGDFLSVLKSHGYEVAPRLAEAAAKFQHEMGKGGIATEGTTVLAVKYKDGVLLAGDRDRDRRNSENRLGARLRLRRTTLRRGTRQCQRARCKNGPAIDGIHGYAPNLIC